MSWPDPVNSNRFAEISSTSSHRSGGQFRALALVWTCTPVSGATTVSTFNFRDLADVQLLAVELERARCAFPGTRRRPMG